MRKNGFPLKFIAALMAFGLLGAACASEEGSSNDTGSGGGSTVESGSDMGAGSSAETGVDTEAAKLTQTLTDLLDSHVYLAGITIEQAVLTEDTNSPQFKAAAATLDQNSQDLAAAIESIYGKKAGDQFLELWRQHIGFFVDYTVGGLTNDTAMQKKAGAALDRYRQDFGAFIDSATKGELPAADVAAALQMHVDSLVKTVDAVIAGDAKAFDLLYEAATGHMPMTATALATGIVASNPDRF